MAELLIRAGSGDAALLRRVYGLDGGPPAALVPDRIVVDAHVAVAAPGIATTAQTAGVPLIVDPQTYFLQDTQHPSFPWTQLEYGRAAAMSPAELAASDEAAAMVEDCVRHQLDHGATAVVAPYLHLERVTLAGATAQARLWRLTRAYLDENHVAVPVIAVIAAGWRAIHPTQGIAQLTGFWDALEALGPDEVAVAASKVNAGIHPDERLVDLLTLVRQLRSRWPVLLWRQGILGEAGVAGGARGYETGIGWNESCHLNQAMAQHRRRTSGHPAARPVYVDALGRSVPKRTLTALRGHRGLWQAIVCLDPACCEPDGMTYLQDSRAHAIAARARSLDALDAIDGGGWKWNHLAAKAEKGLVIADRIERLRVGGVGINRIDAKALQAIAVVAGSRRHRRQMGRTA